MKVKIFKHQKITSSSPTTTQICYLKYDCIVYLIKNPKCSKFPADSHQLTNAKNCCKVAIFMCFLGVDGGGAIISGEVVVMVVMVVVVLVRGGGAVVIGY